MKLSFSRLKRLLTRHEFRTVYQEGRRYIGKKITIFYLADPSSPARLGITINKKWGKAHERNRFKRIVREGFRKCYEQFPYGTIISVHPKEGYRELNSEDIEAELIHFCGKIKSKSTESSCHD